MTDLKETLRQDAAKAESYLKEQEATFVVRTFTGKTLLIVAAVAFVLGAIAGCAL